jgi:hypothetical protein
MPSNNSVNNRFLNQPVTTTAVNYTALPSDVIIEVTNTSVARTITLPAPSATGNVGKAFVIKDTSGGASTNNITITPTSGLIDGQVNTSISSNYGSVQVFCDGSNYYTYGSSSASSSGNALSLVEKVFTTSGTYTPTIGTVFAEVEIVGGGGAGGGAATTAGSTFSVGAGGGGGEYAFGLFPISTISPSQTITIGAGGTAVSGTTGNNGGATSFGSLLTANGGIGGASTPAATVASVSGALGGTGGTGGSFRIAGGPGGFAELSFTVGVIFAGQGGYSYLGSGGVVLNPPSAGSSGLGYGGGGGGAQLGASQSAVSGGAGSAGIVIVKEYISQSATNLPTLSLAKGAWNRQTTSGFNPGTTAIQTPFGSDAGTTPSNSASRIDLSALTQNEGSGLTIAAQQVTITQAGTYQIVGSVAFSFVGGANFFLQCVKNATTVLSLGCCQNGTVPWLESAPIVTTVELAVGDTIDFRISSPQSVSGVTLYAVSLAITQIPSSTLVPVTTWNAVAGTAQTMSANNSYYTQNASSTTLTLPVSCNVGTVMQIAGVGAGGWVLAQNAGQSINFGNQVTTTGTGGSIASTNRYDGVLILCVVANTQWVVLTAVGNLTVT